MNPILKALLKIFDIILQAKKLIFLVLQWSKYSTFSVHKN